MIKPALLLHEKVVWHFCNPVLDDFLTFKVRKKKNMHERRMELVVSAMGGLSGSWPKYPMFVQTGRPTSSSKQ